MKPMEYCNTEEYRKIFRDRNLYGSDCGIENFEKCPLADDIDVSKARNRFPMASESVEEFKNLIDLAGVKEGDTTANYILNMEREFNQFVNNMLEKFNVLKERIKK